MTMLEIAGACCGALVSIAFAASLAAGTPQPPDAQPTSTTSQREELASKAAFDASQGRLRKQLFVVISTAQRRPADLKPVLPDHLRYLASLEERGELFMAGPLMNENPETWSGDGMLIYNVEGIERAREIAANDPLHSTGARSFIIRPWLLNDGSLTLNVRLSNQNIQVP